MRKKLLLFLLAFVLAVPFVAGAESADPSDEDAQLAQEVLRRKQGVIFLQIGNYAAVSDGVLLWIDRANKEVQPYIKQDRTMVPLRFLTEAMGALVGYDEATRGVSVTLGDAVLELWIGEPHYLRNGEPFSMDCAAEILADRTFVPVRFLSEALGKSVTWLEGERIVVITPAQAPWEADGILEKIALSEVQLSLSPLARDKISP